MIDDSRIMILGGSGLLGTELKKLFPKAFCPSHNEWDIIDDYKDALILLETEARKINIIINCVSVNLDDDSFVKRFRTIDVNILGANNVMRLATRIGAKLIYISTDYICGYTDETGGNPVNYYAETKLAAETITKAHPHHLILRGSFSPVSWPYDNAYEDVWCSKLPVNEFAYKIKRAVELGYTGIHNIAGKPSTLWQYAKSISPEKDIKKSRRPNGPLNTSLENTIS